MNIEDRVQEIITQCSREISELLGKPVTLVVFGDPLQKKIPYERIVDAVCAATEIPYKKALKRDRKRELVITRQLIAYYAKQYGALKHREISGKLKYKDHTTSLTSIRKINELIDSHDESICGTIAKINKQLNITT